MPSRLLWVSVVLAVAASPAAATVIVPDDYPTIQQAIDSRADTVRVRDGRYHEDLHIVDSVQIEGIAGPFGLGSGAPEVDSLIVRFPHMSGHGDHDSDNCSFKGVRFHGPVIVYSYASVGNTSTFTTCRFDSGLAAPGYSRLDLLSLLGCVVFRGADLSLGALDCRFTSFFEGTLHAFCEGGAEVSNCVVTGPGATGIELRGPPMNFPRIISNVVSNVDVGIYLYSAEYPRVEGNDVSNCASHGIAGDLARSVTVLGNEVRHAGGSGIIFPSALKVEGNLVEDCGGDGLWAAGVSTRNNTVRRVAGVGIRSSSGGDSCTGNVVTQSGQAGLLCQSLEIANNIVGHCGSNGIQQLGPGSIHHNTTYLNQGSGIDESGAYYPTDLHHNIAYGNEGFGAAIAAGSTLSCNDWFGNAQSAVSGGSPGATDLGVDPVFCGVQGDSVTLRSDSPLLDAPGCGLIGALGQGCVQTITDALVDFRSSSVAGGIVLEWSLASSLGAQRIKLERAPDAIGPWSALTDAAEAQGRFLDETPEADAEYVYRLSAQTSQGWRSLATVQASWRMRPRDYGVELIGANPRTSEPQFLVSLPEAAIVDLRAFDVAGREIATLTRQAMPAGVHRLTWHQNEWRPAGLYFVRLDWGRGRKTARVVVRP